MDNLNFIKTVPEKRKVEVRRWFFFSSLLLGGTILYISAASFIYGYLYYQIPTHQADEYRYTLLQAQRTEKEGLFTKERQKFEKLYSYQHNPKNFVALINAITQIIGSNNLQSCSISSHTCELSINSPSMKKAQQCIQSFEKIPVVNSVQLGSLQQNGTGIKATFKMEHSKKEPAFAGSKLLNN